MNPRPPTEIDFSDIVSRLESGQVWEYATGVREQCQNVAEQTFRALQRPIDFPPIEAAIVSGDRVALAVDPNIPQLDDVISGTLKALEQTDAREIAIVMWDEAVDATIDCLREMVGDAVRVERHDSAHRESLRYLGADELADPIYLNRILVDADFVLPIVAGRPLDTFCAHDLTGVYPAFADSTSRRRHRQRTGASARIEGATDPNEPSWLLGVQIMISVTANGSGRAGMVTAGTPEAIRKELKPARRTPDEFPPAAELVIASLDGDAQQQSWCNAARAVSAAARYAQGGGTIVLWGAIDQTPSGRLMSLGEGESASDTSDATSAELERGDGEGDFPPWDPATGPAQSLARIAAEHRLLIHSLLDDETIESTGVGAIASTEELIRLSRSFATCGVLRAAQFAGTTIDTRHPIS